MLFKPNQRTGQLLTLLLPLTLLSGCNGKTVAPVAATPAPVTSAPTPVTSAPIPTLTVSAGANTSVEGAQSIALNATSNITSTSYSWSITSKPTASTLASGAIQQANTASATITPDQVGQYTFKVTATNGSQTASATKQVTVDDIWQALGGSTFAPAGTSGVSVAVSPDNTPYIAYEDNASGNKLTVKKLVNGTWTLVGQQGFSAGPVSSPSNLDLTFAPDGTPYVAYGDNSLNGKLVVESFNGTQWGDVGTAGFSAGITADAQIRFSSKGTAFVSYLDIPNNQSVTVESLNSGTWSVLGTAGFTGGLTGAPSLAIKGSTPVVAYRDHLNSDKVTVSTYTSGAWSTLGGSAVSTGQGNHPSLAIDATGNVYVAYADAANGGKITARMFNGTQWATVGNAGFSPAAGSSPILRLSASGTLYASYLNSASSRPTVERYVNARWNVVGAPQFTTYSYRVLSMALSLDGTPIVVGGNTIGDAEKLSTIAPQLTQISPGENAQNISATSTITASFDHTMDQSTLTNTSNFAVSDSSGVVSPGSMAYNSSTNTETFTPGASLAGTVSVNLSPNILDLAGHAFSGVQWKFTVPAPVPTGTWQVIGTPDFSAGTANYPALAITSAGTPIFAYGDNPNGNKATVMSYNGTAWSPVGSPDFSPGSISALSLAVGPNNTLYVAYIDGANSSGATVETFRGGAWNYVGSPNLSGGQVNYISLQIASDGTPYVAYVDNTSKKATVEKFNGTNWVDVGAPQFSPVQADNLILALAPKTNTPYVGYLNGSSGVSYTNVETFDGTSWSFVGASDFSPGNALEPTLSIASDGTLYFGYIDAYNSYRDTVQTFNGTKWVYAGNADFTGQFCSYTTVRVGPKGNIFFSFSDFNNNSAASVYILSGSTWKPLGTADFSTSAYNNVMAISPTGAPYVAFEDTANGSKAVVMAYQ